MQQQSQLVAPASVGDQRRATVHTTPSSLSSVLVGNGSPAPQVESYGSTGDDNASSQRYESSTSSGSHSSGVASSSVSQQYLHAAFQTSVSASMSNLQPQQPSQTAATAKQSNNGRQRATSLMAPKEMRLTKNYKELARDFCMLKPFTRLPDGSYPVGTRCVFCEIGAPKTVFFPCQHKCVCDICIKLHDISADRSRAAAWSSCPVCMAEIRLMLPYSGKEEEEYWKWISEVKPSLPSTFKHEFKDAAKRLKKAAVLPGGAFPPSDENNAHDGPPPLTKKPSSRRHTWHSPEAQGSAGYAGGGVDPKPCTIL